MWGEWQELEILVLLDCETFPRQIDLTQLTNGLKLKQLKINKIDCY